MIRPIYLVFFIVLLFSCQNHEKQKIEITDWNEKLYSIEGIEFQSNQNDLLCLNDIVDSAELVCLGESRHDIHEQFKLKSRFVKYLITNMGFTTFALESSFPYSNRFNDFILDGKGNLDDLLSEMPGWFLWDTEEIKELLLWIRKYNLNVLKKVKFYGFDIVAPKNAISQIFEFLKTNDELYFIQTEKSDFAQDLINDDFWPSTMENYAQISDERKKNLLLNFENLYNHIRMNQDEYLATNSVEDIQWILKLAYSAKEANRMFVKDNRVEAGLIRDSAMANITSWISMQNGKTVVWAHNVHISKSAFTMSMFPDTKIRGMGSILSDEFQERMIAICAGFGIGNFKEEGKEFLLTKEKTLENIFTEYNIDFFIADINNVELSKKLKQYLKEEKIIHGHDFEMKFIPAESFDAIFFTRNISKVNYNSQTRDKLFPER